MKSAAFALSALLALLQTPTTTSMNDRELDGLKGPVKRVFEESSMIGDGDGSGIPTTFRCRAFTLIYDPQGRLTSRSWYPGVRCEEEVKDTYMYDNEGNRHGRHDASRASSIRFGPPSSRTSAIYDSVQKRTLEADYQGRLVVTTSTHDSLGRVYEEVKIYDTQNRLIENQSLDSNKRITGRLTFTYTEREPFPASCTSFARDGKPDSRTTYSEYKLNARGDWIRRTEIREQSGRSAFSIQEGSPGGTVSRSARLTYRTIDYY